MGNSGSFCHGGLTLRWASSTDTGKRRTINEDSSGVFPGLFVVADGMGGHEAGEVASRLAVEVAARYADSVPLSLDQLASLVADANDVVHEHSLLVGPAGMGTTLVGVALVENGTDPGLVVFNVGDSRCYELRDGTLRLLTADHSVVHEMVEAGSITQEEADHHPERNVVTRAVGIEDQVAADFVVLDVDQNLRLVLCSDGVSGELGSDELARLVAPGGPADAAKSLIVAVLERPALDNATAVVIDVEWATVAPDGDVDVTGQRFNGPDLAPARAPDLDVTAPVPGREPAISAARPPHPKSALIGVPTDIAGTDSASTRSNRSTGQLIDSVPSADAPPVARPADHYVDAMILSSEEEVPVDE